MILINTPVNDVVIQQVTVGDMIEISGSVFTGRDAILPKVVSLIKKGTIKEIGIDLKGSVIFHTAVSPAGVGPTSSNKYNIENSMPVLSEAGVKIHLGKGSLSKTTIESLQKYNSVYAVIPPVSASLISKIKQKKLVAFPEEGMEAMHLLEVESFPAIVAIAHGESLY